jgi:hypothetical protein
MNACAEIGLEIIRDSIKTPVVFNEAEHTYHLNGEQLRGVSSVVKQFRKPFDSHYWSAYKAKQRGVAQEVVKAEWEAKAKKACDEGTEFHLHAQLRLEGKGKESSSPKAKAFDVWFAHARLHLVPVKCEALLFSEEHKIAGTTDLIAFSTKSKLFHVFDWKTNGKFETTNSYGDRLLAPFNQLEDCALTGYSIQVGIYRKMAQQMTGLPFGDSWIIHIGETVTPHRALNLENEINAALARL